MDPGLRRDDKRRILRWTHSVPALFAFATELSLTRKPLSTKGRGSAAAKKRVPVRAGKSPPQLKETAVEADVDEAAVKPRAIPWNEIRSAYEESALPVSVIAEAYAVRERAVYERASRESWVSRRTQAASPVVERSLDRSVLVGRLFHAVERQIAEIERRFIDLAGNGADERDARTLAALARTLELLIGLERQSKPDPSDAPEADIDEIRRDLARRITNLRRAEPD
jgi:hypothetical protein